MKAHRKALKAAPVIQTLFAVCMVILFSSCSRTIEKRFPIKGDMAHARDVAIRLNDGRPPVLIRKEIPQIRDTILASLQIRYSKLSSARIIDNDTMSMAIDISMYRSGEDTTDKKIIAFLEKHIREVSEKVSQPLAPSSDQHFALSFGILKEYEKGAFKMMKETDSIPLISKPARFYHGFIIKPAISEGFEVSAKIYLPETSRKFRGVTFDGHKQDLAEQMLNEGIDYPKFRVNRDAYLALQFDKGDPAGEWRIVLFLNNKVEADVTYQVFETAKPESFMDRSQYE